MTQFEGVCSSSSCHSIIIKDLMFTLTTRVRNEGNKVLAEISGEMSGEIDTITWNIRKPTSVELMTFAKKRQEKALGKQLKYSPKIFVLKYENGLTEQRHYLAWR